MLNLLQLTDRDEKNDDSHLNFDEYTYVRQLLVYLDRYNLFYARMITEIQIEVDLGTQSGSRSTLLRRRRRRWATLSPHLS